MKTKDETDDAVQYLTSIIKKAAWIATPQHKMKHTSIQYTDFTLQLVKEKRMTGKERRKTRFPAHKTKLNRISRELCAKINGHKNRMLTKYFEELSPNDTGKSSLWKTTKYLK